MVKQYSQIDDGRAELERISYYNHDSILYLVVESFQGDPIDIDTTKYFYTGKRLTERLEYRRYWPVEGRLKTDTPETKVDSSRRRYFYNKYGLLTAKERIFFGDTFVGNKDSVILKQ